jgi:branched-chain amino acid transport system ATP-binding protein
MSGMPADLVWQVERLAVGYGPKQVLFDLAFQQAQGEIVCLLGHNGAGKSTLLKVLYGLVPPRGGTIRYRTHDVSAEGSAARLRSGIAYMPEGRGVFQTLTVAENLRLGLAAARVAPRERPARLAEVFRVLPMLEEFRDRRAGLLSGGQQQMLSLGRTILSRPSCLLLDEPSIGLAPKLFQDLLATIRQIQRELGMAILLVEQNVREALAVADRVYVMKAGRMIYEGLPAELDDHKTLIALY